MICSQLRLRTRSGGKKSIAQSFSRFRRAPLVAKTGALILQARPGIRHQFLADGQSRLSSRPAAGRHRRRGYTMQGQVCDG
jgi:hypothetical protein